MTLAALGVGVWLGLTLDVSVYPLTLGIGGLSVALATVAWTLVQRHGEPARATARSPGRRRRSAAGGLACLCIAGPTASGKSRAAMAVAARLAPQRRSRSSASTRPRSIAAWTSAPPSRRRPSAPRCRTT